MTTGQQPGKFADLTWQDLEEWAGSRVVSRGKSYTKRVLDLRVTPEGGLLARVVGTAIYATQVERSGTDDLDSSCTCPYEWGPCKHAVAVILAALDALKKKRPLHVAGPDGEKLRESLGMSEEGLPFPDDAQRKTDPEQEVEREEEVMKDSSKPPAPASRRRAGTSRGLRDYVSDLAKRELIELVLELADTLPEVGNRLRDRQRLEADVVGKVVREVRRQIEALAAEPAWSNSWSGEGHIPDYSGVRDRLEAMLAAGYADEVVALGEELLRLGPEQMGMSDDDGELGTEIGQCMDVVFRALPMSSMSAADQLLWDIDARMQDQYSALDAVEYPVSDAPSYSSDDWSQVADVLAERLRALPETARGKKIGGYTWDWSRQQLLRALVAALGNAGRDGDAIDLLEREAATTGCYPELVDRLLAAGRREDARRWAETGFHATVDGLAGIAWGLEERLRGIAEEERDAKAVAAYRSLEFFDHPDLGSYIALRDASKAAGVWTALGPMIMQYLESGDLPGELATSGTSETRAGPKRTSSNRAGKKAGGAERAPPEWPLPSIGLQPSSRRGLRENSPHAETLVRIAIHEERPDDVVTWYERIGTRRGLYAADLGDEVAAAVQGANPEVSIGIWRKKAEAWIAQVKPSAYQEAGRYLTRLEGLYRELDRADEWRAYLAGLRTANRRRPRMMEVLDSVEGKRRRILEG